MNKKIDSIANVVILSFLIVITVISLSIDVGAYFANHRAIDFVNRDVNYLTNMQGTLSEIPTLEKPILIQQCQSMLISSVQDKFSFYSLATFLMAIVAVYIFRNKITEFDNDPANRWMVFKHGKKVSAFLIPIFIGIASMFFGFAIVAEQSQEQTIGQMLSGITGNETGQKDKLLLLEIHIFDTSQTYFRNLHYGFYFTILGISFFVSYITQVLKRNPNMLSSVIFYSTIIAFVYISLFFLTTPVQSYSNFVNSDIFRESCKNLVNSHN